MPIKKLSSMGKQFLMLCAVGLFSSLFASAQEFRPVQVPQYDLKREKPKPDLIGRVFRAELYIGLPASTLGDNLSTAKSMKARYAYGVSQGKTFSLGEYWGYESNPIASGLGFRRNTVGAILTVNAMNFGVGWVGAKLNQKGEATHKWPLRVAALAFVGGKIAWNSWATVHNIHTIHSMDAYVRERTDYQGAILWRSH